jgi:hypothetical protein
VNIHPSVTARTTYYSTADAVWWLERFYLATAQTREVMLRGNRCISLGMNPLNMKLDSSGPACFVDETLRKARQYREDVTSIR